MIKGNIKIIEFQSQYRDQVIKLIDSILKELDVIPNTETLIDDEDLFKISEIYSGKGKFWIALDDNEVVGTIAVRDLGSGKAKLNRMFVLESYRGSGLAQTLLDTALDHARLQRFTEIILNTHLFMKRAHRFYEKNGFNRISQELDKYNYLKPL